MLDDARDYLERGISILPLRTDSKKPLGRWKRFQERPLTPDDARAWWGVFQPPPGIGVVTGAVSRDLVVLDIEPEHVNEVLSAVELPEGAAVARTARGGLHVYCRGQRRSGHLKIEGHRVGDIRGTGGYVVAPPTKTGAGRYGWEAALEAPEELPEVPAWAEGGEPLPWEQVELDKSPPPVPSRSLHARLPSFVVSAVLRPQYRRQTPSECDYWVCVHAIRAGLSYGEVAAIFETSPIGRNLERHGDGYLERTYGAAWLQVERELAGEQLPRDPTRTVRLKCVRVGVFHSPRGVGARAVLALWDPAERRVHDYSFSIYGADGCFTAEWQQFAEAFGVDPASSPVFLEGRRAWAAVEKKSGRVLWFFS